MNADEYGKYVNVTFYDTNKDDEDIDVNQVLFNKILKDMASTFQVQVIIIQFVITILYYCAFLFSIGDPLQPGRLIELYVTHIDECGKVYAQLNSLAKTVLNDENMSEMSLNNTMIVKAIHFTRTYLAQWNSQWYRARVTDIPNEQEVMIFLIDIGRTILISREKLFHMNRTSKALQDIPPQVKEKQTIFFSLNLVSLLL